MSDQVIDSFMVPVGAQQDEAPDPALFWRWVGGAARPLIGWGLGAIGILVIIVGWYGVSGQALVAKQLPYLISGGLGGVALVGIGAALIGTERLRQDARRIARLEEMVKAQRPVLLFQDHSPAHNNSTAGQVLRGKTGATTEPYALSGQ